MEGHGGGHIQGHHGISPALNATREPPPLSYFYYSEHTTLLSFHVILSVLAWCFTLPIAVFLSIAKSRYTPIAHFIFSALNGAALAVGVLYNAQTPDLYENNVHHRLGWGFSVVSALYSVVAVICTYAGPKSKPHTGANLPFLAANYKVEHRHSWSRDSGVGSSVGEACPRDSIPGSPYEDEDDNDYYDPAAEHGQYQHAEFDEDEDRDEGKGLLHTGSLHGKLTPIVKIASGKRIARVLGVLYEIVNRLILILGFVLVTSGIVTYGGIFKDREIFSGLAHFIKGGIFFWYGLLTLGRVMGSFGELGWAWNVKPSTAIGGQSTSNTPSLEFLESFLIFFYGSTNVFLEHLASEDGTWSATDLEHVAVAVMFLGGGLCGMLVESKRVRSLLNSTVTGNIPPKTFGDQSSTWDDPKSYGYSLNPMPALIIMLLGIMMSSHHQASMVSTMLHSQWGSLFVGASLARGVTYLLMYLSPPASYLPSRPPSEIVVAFCFISGGLIFMCSNESMVQGMENLGLNAMFLFTVLMGLTAFIMAWEIVVLAVKGLAQQKEESLHCRTLSQASTQA